MCHFPKLTVKQKRCIFCINQPIQIYILFLIIFGTALAAVSLFRRFDFVPPHRPSVWSLMKRLRRLPCFPCCCHGAHFSHILVTCHSHSKRDESCCVRQCDADRDEIRYRIFSPVAILSWSLVMIQEC